MESRLTLHFGSNLFLTEQSRLNDLMIQRWEGESALSVIYTCIFEYKRLYTCKNVYVPDCQPDVTKIDLD